MKCCVYVFSAIYLISFSFATLYEGDRCELPFREQGKCVRLSQCPTAIQLVRNRQHPKICSFIRSTPIVCCPILAGPLYPRLSERKCQNYKAWSTTTTTTTTTTPQPLDELDRISEVFLIGGVRSLTKEFPHMAALGYTNGNEIVWLCGGSLISEKYVLTAAHCLFSREYGPLQWARLGDLALTSTIDDALPEDYPIVRRLPHPRYKAPSVYHDIALLQLSRTVSLSSYVKPACLPPLDLVLDSSRSLVATGWGLTEYGGRQSDFLQKVDLEVFTNDECWEAYSDGNTRRLSEGIVHERMFCAGGRDEEKDTCQGDSGGPLQIQDGDTFTVVGITSFGKSCGIKNVPGVYTKVAPYVPWIESVVWPDEF